MGNPMPLFERYAKGTEWVLTVPFSTYPAGSRVRVEEEPHAWHPGSDELICTVTHEFTEQTFDVPVEILG